MKKIIVATDYSTEANNAMQYAAAAAAQAQYEIVLFNFNRLSIHLMNARVSSNTINNSITQNETKLQKTAEKLALQYAIHTESYFGIGDFDEAIEKCITECHADLVVVGMPEKSLEQDLMGDTTTKMLHSLKVPTLAIPAGLTYQPIQNILFACDIVRGVHKLVLRNVSEIAKDFNAKVEIFYVSKKVEEIAENKVTHTLHQLKREHQDVEFSYKNVQSDEIIESIHEEIEVYDADILIMVPYKYGFWGSLVHRSKTKEMASGNKIPLLSIPL